MNVLRRVWSWYCRITGWDVAQLQRQSGLRIRSTAFPKDLK